MKTATHRPFRLGDLMILVAATAVGFAIYRESQPFGGFTTFGGSLEQWLFFWMHRVVPFPAVWSLAVLAITVFDRGASGRRSRRIRMAGSVACCAAVAVLGLTMAVASTFYGLHVLEELALIPKIFTHPRATHVLPPFGNAPMEEITGASVLGAWASMAASGRWRTQPTWIDRSGRVLGVFWIALFLIYLYAYTG